MALADILLVDNTGRIGSAHVICFTRCCTSGWSAAHFQVARIALESLQALANTEAVLDKAFSVRPADTILARTNAVAAVVDARHASTSVATLAVSLAQAVLGGRRKGRWDRPSSRGLWDTTPSGGRHRAHGRSGNVSATPGNHAAWTLGCTGKQRVSGHSLRTDAPEAAKRVDATSISATDAAAPQAFVDVVAVREGISLKTRGASAVQLVSGSKTLRVGAAT